MGEGKSKKKLDPNAGSLLLQRMHEERRQLVAKKLEKRKQEEQYLKL